MANTVNDVANPVAGRSGGSSREDSVDEDSSMWVLPLLLLLLLFAGFLWCCISSPSLQDTMPHSSNNVEPSEVASLHEEAWEDTSLPMIALLIVAGYALAIFAIMYLPMWIGAEASIWVLLSALVLVLTWNCWSGVVLDLLTYRLSWICLAIFAGVCCMLYPIVRIISCGGQPRASKLCKVKSLDHLLVEQLPENSSRDAPSSLSKAVEKPAMQLVEKAAVPHQMPDGTTSEPSMQSGAPSASGMPVYLHVYDVTHEESVGKLNALLAPRLCPLKLGGLFHVGVEVNGREWCYGYCTKGSGVSGLRPRTHPSHVYRETICLPCTQLSEEKIVSAIQDLSSQYKGSDYNLLRRNCIHFADDLCLRLGVGGVPFWIHRLVRAGEVLHDSYLRISQLFERTGKLWN